VIDCLMLDADEVVGVLVGTRCVQVRLGGAPRVVGGLTGSP
jgi:hypothetical protein